MSVVIHARSPWPRRLRTAARVVGPIAGLLAAVATLTLTGYWILTHAGSHITIVGWLASVAPLYATAFWLIARDRTARELIDKAVDDADRALGAAQQPTDDQPPTGRHAKRTP